MSQETLTELTLLIQSGWQLVALETFEEERALRVLQRTAKSCERELLIWSLASGTRAGGQGAGSFDEGLKAISARGEPASRSSTGGPGAGTTDQAPEVGRDVSHREKRTARRLRGDLDSGSPSAGVCLSARKPSWTPLLTVEKLSLVALPAQA